MFMDWITGKGDERRTFGPGTPQVNDMRDATGVNRAKKYFYKKNAARLSMGCDPLSLEELTDYNPGFGLKGLIEAGLDPTEQFVGNYRVDVYPNADNTITIVLSNNTSMTSLLYSIGPSWDRSSFGPGGNMYQIYTWKEPIR